MRLGSVKSVLMFSIVAFSGAGCQSKIGTKSQSGAKKDVIPPLVQPPAPTAQPPTFTPPEVVTETPTEPTTPEASGSGSGSTSGSASPPNPVPEAIDNTTSAAAGLVEFQKTAVQSGDPISVRVNGAFFEGASTFAIESILPDGTHVVLLEGDAAMLAGSMGEGYKITPQPDGSILFEFFPGPGGSWDGKFGYGENVVRVTVDDPVEPRFADFPVKLKDFDVFGLTLASFGNGQPIVEVQGPNGYRFQGWIDLVSPAVAKADGVVLSNGFFNIINPR